MKRFTWTIPDGVWIDVHTAVALYCFLKSISPGPHRSDRFVRRAAPPCHTELCPFFSHNHLEVATDVVLKPSSLPKP